MLQAPAAPAAGLTAAGCPPAALGFGPLGGLPLLVAGRCLLAPELDYPARRGLLRGMAAASQRPNAAARRQLFPFSEAWDEITLEAGVVLTGTLSQFPSQRRRRAESRLVERPRPVANMHYQVLTR